jgi:hypothetical protein
MSIKRPKPGMVLTNGEVFIREGGYVDIGANDKPENWYDITEEEYNRIKAEEEKEYTENI